MTIYICSTLDGDSMKIDRMKAFFNKDDAIKFCNTVSTDQVVYFFSEVEIVC